MAKQRDGAAWITKAIKDRRAGIERSGQAYEESVSNDLSEHITDGQFDAVKVLPNSLGQLGSCADGVIGVIDGNDDAWVQVDRGIKYQYWRIKFAAAGGLMQTRPDYPEKFNPFNMLYHEMPLIPGLIYYAIVHDLNEMRDELWQLFQQVLATPRAITDNYWGGPADGKYELFSFQLFARTPWGAGAKLPETLQRYDLAPYAHVLAAWEEPDALAFPLTQVCDYHCQNLEQHGSHGPWPPFYDPPFDLVPYEILAIYKLRAQQGLETPEIDHPLMKLPTASRAPREVHKIDDPIFAKIEALFHKHCQPFWNDTLGL